MTRSVYQNFLDRHVRAHVAPGLSAIIYDRNGLIFEGFSGAHSFARDGTPAKSMKEDTIQWFASATKITISIIVLSILEKGIVKGLTLDSLDDHEALLEFLPEFRIGSNNRVAKILEGFGPIGTDGKTELILREAKVKVTLRHLMTHSAGLAYEFTHPLITELYRPTEGLPHYDLLSATGAIKDFDVPRLREAGMQMGYGPAADWLSLMAVRATGKHLRQLFNEIIMQPLAIDEAELDIARSRLPEKADFAKMYARNCGCKGKLEYVHIPLNIYSPETDEPPKGYAYFAGAGIHGTVRAFGQILQACMNHDDRLLKDSTWKMAEIDAWDGNMKMPSPLWKSGMPEFTLDIDVFAPSPNGCKGYGMNLLQQHVAKEKTYSGRPAGSYTWAGLGNSYYFVDPVNGITSMISTQVLPFADPQLIRMRDDWEKLIYSQQAKGK